MKKLFLKQKEESFLIPPLPYPTQENSFRLILPSQSFHILVFLCSLFIRQEICIYTPLPGVVFVTSCLAVMIVLSTLGLDSEMFPF